MNIREETYSSKTIIGGWRSCGLLEDNPYVALSEYKRQMHYNTVTPEDSVQEEPVIEPEVGNISTPAPQKKRRKRKGNLESTGESSLFELNAALMEENRRLQSEVKRVRRDEDKALTLLDITSRKLEQCKNELPEKKRNHSR